MIYKATSIQAHRVEIPPASNHFIPTNGFRSNLSDMRVLSHFNEDQSMMQQYTGENYPSPSQAMDMSFTQFYAPFAAQVKLSQQQGAPNPDLISSTSGYDSSYMHSDMAARGFETASKIYEDSNLDALYGSYASALPAASPYFHPPMLVPQHYHVSPPATSSMSSVSPGPSPRKQELQIRMSQPCYEMGQHHHEILPLETGPFKK